jgi:hypothetical protein
VASAALPGPLAGATFVFTGKLHVLDRRTAEELVQSLGGKAASDVSARTTHLVVGEKAGSKLDRARKLGVTIMDEGQFQDLVSATAGPSSAVAVSAPAPPAVALPPSAPTPQTLVPSPISAPPTASAPTRRPAEQVAALVPSSFDGWKLLDAKVQERILDWVALKPGSFPTLQFQNNMPIDQIQSPAARAFADRMRDYMESNGNVSTTDTNEYQATVGPVKVTASVASLASGEVIGGTIKFHQAGAGLDDGSSGHFDTPEEARAAGADTGADVSWSAYATFNHEVAEPLGHHCLYMEWGGY